MVYLSSIGKRSSLKSTVSTGIPLGAGCTGVYRFGFNGQERDDEVAGSGNITTAEFWEYDSRLGRRWNCDPVDKPWMSSYQAFSNKPIINIDPNGANDGWYEGEDGLRFDADVHSQEDLETKGIQGSYKGETISGHTQNGAGYYGDAQGNLSVSLPSVIIKAPNNLSGPAWATQAIQGYQSGIFTEGDKSVNYSPLEGIPDAVGIQVSGTAIAGAGISQTWTFGYMRDYGFFATVGPGEGAGWDQSLSVSCFAAYYSGDNSKPDFESFLGLSNANTVGASVICIGQSADISTNALGQTTYGANWNTGSIGISIGTDDVSTVFSASAQYQQTNLLWKSW